MTHEYLLEYATYNKEDGWFYKKSNGRRIGYEHIVYKGLDSSVYIRVGHKGKYYYAHRLALFYTYGEYPIQVDHINGNTLDNSFHNLRAVTAFDNMKNMKKTKANKSGTTGVCWNKRYSAWEVNIHYNNKKNVMLYI